MKVMHNNINNMNVYWQALGAKSEGGYFINHTWPNKIWSANLSLDLNEQSKLLNAGQSLMTVDVISEDELATSPVVLKGQLVMMDLDLTTGSNATPSQTDLSKQGRAIVQVEDQAQADLWTEACSKAFNYQIDKDAIRQFIQDENSFVLALTIDGEIAATAIGYLTGDTLGIHQVGTVPDFRKQGAAAQLMHYLLEIAVEKSCTTVSLQASKAGFHLYQKLGFNQVGTLTSLKLA
ncbi:GNAT family N-acetyltransferase [Catenovulum sp. SM1970]|uniref:GNAT family N-acetyltransferase n=1 Tax=Marinifaba aquimaris TaxID=2741323 RepID=UPI001574B11A|nr:GNAT family N-acetyltransferase [Marinifaba aquimaris]NTS78823.1 GNAT family N-acetyltransferase [Marinifaba aquimaris]